ncbi:hypothetical protein M8J76_005751 [Diaphorina citri]|nr:hypothetical protein M8J75_008647 [Diaphorina citri]KAI5732928.1 hypothetical protein M8J76_005751 [Diaphorina citri]
MASFAFHDLENRIDHIETTRLKTQNNVSKPQRAVLGVINQNTSKADLSRKAKTVANQKIGLKVQNPNTNQCSKAIEKPIQQQKPQQYSSSIFPRHVQKPTNAFPFKIHEDDSTDEVTDKEEKHHDDKEYGNEENEVFDEVAMLPQAFCKAKVWKDEEEPMSLEKSILSPMSVDLSQTEKGIPTRNVEDMVCMLINADDYRDDIYQYLLKCERRIRPKANYMRKQNDINSEMRSVLVDWLIEVAEEYKMHNETLHLAINYVDRFLSLMSVVRSKLQLLGTTALFVASKYEEIYPPEVNEFVYITDDTYTKKQLLKMETLILKVLNFDLNIPTVHSFICHITVSGHLDQSVLYLAQYLSELALVSGDPFLQFLPSLIACSAIALARYCLDYKEAWPSSLADITGHSLDSLTECVKCLHEVHRKGEAASQKAAYNKYKLNLWKNVSTVEARTFT